MALMGKAPAALIVQPPVYDFALYDLHLKPYGLLRIGRWLADGGYSVSFANALGYRDPASDAVLGAPKRSRDGTGHFYRSPVPAPPALAGIPRRYARYGRTAESLRAEMRRVRPDVVLITSGMTYWYEGVAEAVRLAREVHPDVPVLVGGTYASLLPEHARSVTEADTVIPGSDLRDIAAALAGLGLPVPEGAPGHRLFIGDEDFDSAPVRLNGGCPFGCAYCASSVLAPVFVPGDPEEAFRAVEELHAKAGTRHFAFYDDALLVGSEQVLIPFLRMVREAGLDVDFALPNAVHVGRMDHAVAREMRLSGFTEVRLGFESAAAGFRDRYGDKWGDADFDESLAVLEDAGFPAGSVTAYILAGLPGQRAAEVEDSIVYCLERGIRASVAEYSPVPGTALWEESVRRSRYPIEDEPLFQNNTVFPMEWAGFTRADLERLKRIARGGSIPGRRPGSS